MRIQRTKRQNWSVGAISFVQPTQISKDTVSNFPADKLIAKKHSHLLVKLERRSYLLSQFRNISKTTCHMPRIWRIGVSMIVVWDLFVFFYYHYHESRFLSLKIWDRNSDEKAPDSICSSDSIQWLNHKNWNFFSKNVEFKFKLNLTNKKW